MNIPDENNCKMCQPRVADKNRAQMLQPEKRMEQSLFLDNNNLQLQQVVNPAVINTNLLNVPVSTSGIGSGGGKGANQYTTGKALPGGMKNKTAGTGSKKKRLPRVALAIPEKINKKQPRMR